MITHVPKNVSSLPMVWQRPFRLLLSHWFWLIGAILMSNVLTFRLASAPAALPRSPSKPVYVYLADQLPASIDPRTFSQRITHIAAQLEIPPAWLMAVMHAESRFDASVYNRKGSGAVGLIQFMPATARELGTTSQDLSVMQPIDQLTYVATYFELVKQRYGPYQSLTDLYLAVLYPKARGQDPCFHLYVRPSKAYRQNSGLDVNQDGAVTVQDVDQLLRQRHPQAYHAIE